MNPKTILTYLILTVFVMMSVYGGVSTYSMLGGQTFSLFGEQVYSGFSMSMSCDPRPDQFNLAPHKIESHTDEPTFYHCTTLDAKKYGVETWIPEGTRCEFIVDDFSALVAYICPGIVTSDNNLGVCTKIGGFGASPIAPTSLTVNAGDTVLINTDAFGTGTLIAKYPSYGLNIESAQGFDFPQTASCRSDSFREKYVSEDAIPLVVIPGQPENIITSIVPIESTQAVVIDGINFGKPIWVTNVNKYVPIKEIDNAWYVDYSEREIFEPKIECIPGSLGCSYDALIIELEDQECDNVLGNTLGYSAVAGDETQLCEVICVDGKRTITDNCRAVIVDCPSGTTFSQFKGECVEIEDLSKDSCTEKGGDWVDKETRVCGFLCDLGIKGAEITTTSECKIPFNSTPIIILIVGIIGAIIIVSIGQKSGSLRRK